jgi:hypothetical protein
MRALINRTSIIALAALGVASPALAVNPFTLVDDGYPFAVHQLEYENTLNVQHAVSGDSRYLLIGNESELEYGLTENIVVTAVGGLYHERANDPTEGTHFDQGGLQVQYFFTNPNTDAIGVSVIATALFGETTFASENSLVLQKDFEKWIVAYNLGVNVEVDGFLQSGPADTTMTLSHSAGALYCLTNTVRVGAEFQLATTYREFFRAKQDTTLYFGPVVNWIVSDDLWITVGLNDELVRKTDGATQYQLNIVFGYDF